MSGASSTQRQCLVAPARLDVRRLTVVVLRSRSCLASALLAAMTLASVGCADGGPTAEPLDLVGHGAFLATTEELMLPAPEGDPEPIEVTLYVPMLPGGPAPAQSSAKLVVFVPSLGVASNAHEVLLSHVVSHGYAVLSVAPANSGPDHMRHARRVLAAAQYVLDNVALDSGAQATFDRSRVALMGYSLGAKIALLAATIDHPLREAVRAVVAWDPIDSDEMPGRPLVSIAPERMAEVRVPTLIFGTPESSCVVAGNNHDDVFASALPPSLHLVFPSGDHLDWGDDFGEGVYGFFVASNVCYLVGVDSGTVVHRVTRRSQVAWLKQYLDDEPDMQRYLTGDQADEVQSGKVGATEK